MKFKTLYQYIWEEVQYNGLSIELAKILMDISIGGKILRENIERSVFTLNTEIFGANVHGENQHSLDILAHNVFCNVLDDGNVCRYLISEENEQRIEFKVASKDSEFEVYIDPLDGTSNLDANVSVGSIFSIYNNPVDLSSKRSNKVGRRQIGAGYLIYGTSTMLVITFGSGVNGFTYDKNIGEFLLTHPKIKVNKFGNSYAINEGNFGDFPIQIRKYLTFCKQSDEDNKLPYTLRYIGSMVADIHRILLNGGIFMYPSTRLNPKGKLRLMYECNPIAMIIEQAGGLAIDGMSPVLDVTVSSYHQKIPFIAGSYNMVKNVLNLYKNESINNHMFYSC
jgi:fructose-1,6-bisphosphatase I